MTRKPGNRPETEPTKIAKRRAKVSEMYAGSRTMRSIAAELGVSRQTICTDVAAITAVWQEEAVKDIGKLKAREIAVLNDIAQKAVEDWHLSKENATKVKKTVDASGDEKVETWAEGRTGDPRYLANMLSCSAQRSKILGLDAPIELNNNITEFRVAGKTPEDVRQDVANRLEALLPKEN